MNTATKIITLWQPWASEIALGRKRYETRHWYTPYRGKLIIHAAKRAPEPTEFPVPWTQELPLGCIVAVCDLVDCIQMTDGFIERQTWEERIRGLWERGRYAWKLDNVQKILPVTFKGQQGLKPFDDWDLLIPDTGSVDQGFSISSRA